MKNLLTGIFILVIAVSCNQKRPGSTSEANSGLQLTRVTLNGIPFDEADKMVKEYQADPSSSNPKTSIWFSEQYVKKIDSILKEEGGDGMRIYFAKKGGKNTIVIVSTKPNGSTNSPSKIKHKDYFEHYAPILTSSDAKIIEDYGTDQGATLYSSTVACPADNCPTSYNHITCKDAHAWVTKFNQWGNAKINTSSLWFSDDLLSRIVKELEPSASTARDGDGIRIYFAVKPPTATQSSERHTLVIAATEPVGTGHRDYYDCSHSFIGIDSRSDANDNGEECPNFCDDVTWQ